MDCCVLSEPSIEMSTSKPAAAACWSNCPFFTPAHPIRCTLVQECPGRYRSSRQFTFSSSKIFISGVGEDFVLDHLEHFQHLFALHAGEAVEKDLDRIARP